MQNITYETLGQHYYNQNPRKLDYIRYKKKANTRQKRKSGVKKTAAFAVWATMLLLSTSVCLDNFLNPAYINRINNKNFNPEIRSIYAPTLNYMHNLSFENENILAPIMNKGRETVLTINSSGENTGLKNEILNILDKYKNLHAGIFVYDYMSGKTVQINEDEIFPSASIIKVPVLLDLFNRSKNLEKEGVEPINLNKKITFTEAHRTEGSGRMQFGSANTEYTIDNLAKAMIRSSDNSATNMLIEEVGGINELNAALRHWGFKKTQVSNWLPDLNGTNTTTPKEIATMLYNIDNQKFMPMKYAADIKEYMSQVENQTLIKSQMPKDAILMHKTGDIGKMLGDAGVIISPSGKKFILAIMVKRPHNDSGARELIQKVSKAVYDNLN